MSNHETRTRLLDTALKLIWQSNYSSVGVNEICKEAGVTKGGFYHHFESKAVLFCEATDYFWESTKKAIDEIVSPINPPLEQLKLYIEYIFSKKFDEVTGKVLGSPYLTCGSHADGDNNMINNSLNEMCSNGIAYNMAIIRTLQTDGYLDGLVDIEQRARLLSQYIQGAVAFARIDGDVTAIKSDFPEGIFRVIGLKHEHWFNPFE